MDEQHLHDVAKAWNAAKAAGESPLPAVQAVFPGVTYRTIQRWIGSARQANLLPPARPGNWGVNEQKFRQAADALGVRYEELVIALWESGSSGRRISATEVAQARLTLEGGG